MSTKPAPKLERNIEASFIQKVKKEFPWLRAPKLTSMSQRSWPDRLIPLPKGKTLYIEFKRPGEKPTPLQDDCHTYLLELGHDVRVFDNADNAFGYLKAVLKWSK